MSKHIVVVVSESIDLRLLAMNLRCAEEEGDMELFSSLLRAEEEPVDPLFGFVHDVERFFGAHRIEMRDFSDEVFLAKSIVRISSAPHYRDLEYKGKSRRSELRRSTSKK